MVAAATFGVGIHVYGVHPVIAGIVAVVYGFTYCELDKAIDRAFA